MFDDICNEPGWLDSGALSTLESSSLVLSLPSLAVTESSGMVPIAIAEGCICKAVASEIGGARCERERWGAMRVQKGEKGSVNQVVSKKR